MAESKFASLDDMKYYDEECEAHKTLKMRIGALLKEPPLTVYFTDAVSGEGEFLRLQ